MPFNEFENCRIGGLRHLLNKLSEGSCVINGDLENDFGHNAKTARKYVRLGIGLGLVGWEWMADARYRKVGRPRRQGKQGPGVPYYELTFRGNKLNEWFKQWEKTGQDSTPWMRRGPGKRKYPRPRYYFQNR